MVGWLFRIWFWHVAWLCRPNHPLIRPNEMSVMTMQGNALCEFTLLLSIFLIRFFVIDPGLNPCDMQLFLKAGSAYSWSPSLSHFLGAISRQDKMVVQSVGLHPHLYTVYFYRNYTANPTLGTHFHLELGSPNFILLQWKVFIDFHLMLFLKLHFSISEICPCGCSLGFQKWSYGVEVVSE